MRARREDFTEPPRPWRLQRERLTRRLLRAASRPVALLVAPAGYGKSAVVDDYLSAERRVTVRYRVPPETRTLLGFIRGLTESMADLVPGAFLSFAIAYERSVKASTMPGDLARWFLEHIGALEATLVLDDLHNAEAAPFLAEFVTALVAGTPAKLRWVLAARCGAVFPIASWLAHGMTEIPIDEAELRFTRDEAFEAAHLAGVRPGEDIESLFRRTEGWAAAFTLGLAVDPQGLAGASGEPSFYAALVERVLRTFAPDVRGELLATAAYPDLDPRTIDPTSSSSAVSALVRLRATVPFVFTDIGGTARYHDLFRGELLAMLNARGELERATHAAASNLVEANRIDDALELFNRIDAPAEVIALLEREGLAFVDQGKADIVESCIARLDAETLRTSPTLLAMRAILDSHRDRFDTAEAWFVEAIEQAPHGDVRTRVVYRYAIELIRRGRSDCVALLEPYARDPNIPADLRAPIFATLATAYVAAGREDDAGAAVDAALDAIDLCATDALRARVYHQIAWVALHHSQGERAKFFAAKAIDVALGCGSYDVAARAYTVLYNVALDIDDDPRKSLACLESFAQYGMRAANSELHTFALLAAFDLEAERGEFTAMERIERSLAEIDLASHSAAVNASYIPAEGLRSAWRGDFKQAYRLCGPGAKRELTLERQAIRLADAAVYAAAGGFPDESRLAIADASAALDPATVGAKTRVRLSTTLALAFVVLGQLPQARALLAQCVDAADCGTSRGRARIRAVGSLIDYVSGHGSPGTLRSAIDELRSRDLGGFAALIEALPLWVCPSCPKGEAPPSLAHDIFVQPRSRFTSRRRANGVA